jgi:hypothetical protein
LHPLFESGAEQLWQPASSFLLDKPPRIGATLERVENGNSS